MGEECEKCRGENETISKYLDQSIHEVDQIETEIEKYKEVEHKLNLKLAAENLKSLQLHSPIRASLSLSSPTTNRKLSSAAASRSPSPLFTSTPRKDSYSKAG